MRACRKYWLMAVSSLKSTLFKCCTTLASPFIGPLREKPRFDAEGLGASRKPKGACSGRSAQRLGRTQVAKELTCALATTSATGTDTELKGKLLERARAVARALADCLLGD